jgi:hypothetical protein
MPATDPADGLAARITRRRVLATGSKLAYAAPLVAATMHVRGGQAAADLDPETLCNCYGPREFRWVNLGGACAFPLTEPCGACHSCAPLAGADCPSFSTGVGSEIPQCFDPNGELCRGVIGRLCTDFLISPTGP